MSAARKDLRRKSDLAAIHVAVKQLGLDESTYREMLSNLTRGRIISAADATADERRVIIEHLRKRGFKPVARPLENPQDRMARGMWIELAKEGVIRDRRESAFRKFAKRVTGVDRLEWMNGEQANQVIEALKAIKARAAAGEKHDGAAR